MLLRKAYGVYRGKKNVIEKKNGEHFFDRSDSRTQLCDGSMNSYIDEDNTLIDAKELITTTTIIICYLLKNNDKKTRRFRMCIISKKS